MGTYVGTCVHAAGGTPLSVAHAQVWTSVVVWVCSGASVWDYSHGLCSLLPDKSLWPPCAFLWQQTADSGHWQDEVLRVQSRRAED